MNIIEITDTKGTRTIKRKDGNAAMHIYLTEAENRGVVFPRENGADDYSYTDTDVNEILDEVETQMKMLGFTMIWSEI